MGPTTELGRCYALSLGVTTTCVSSRQWESSVAAGSPLYPAYGLRVIDALETP
jgi:hypothetical protein